MSRRPSAKGNGAQWRRRLEAARRADNEGPLRDALLEGARQGDERAIAELWVRYRLRLIAPSKTA
jgi:hypothetical protein